MKDFASLRLKMEKGEVTDLIGSPTHLERRYGKDWWYYTLVEGRKKYDRMVVFQDGVVVYAGRVTAPKFVKDPDKIDTEHDIGDKGLQTPAPSLVDGAKPTTLPEGQINEPVTVNPGVVEPVTSKQEPTPTAPTGGGTEVAPAGPAQSEAPLAVPDPTPANSEH